MKVIYVNSTLSARRAMYADGEVSPLHFWGYAPSLGDPVYGHRVNRWEIRLRAFLDGLDPRLWLRVFWDLCRGHRALYLVTQPDLRLTILLWTWLFPNLRVVTWAWNPAEARAYFRQLRRCALVLCLTEGARDELLCLGCPSARAVLQIWGTDPAFYARSGAPAPDKDVLLFGIICRDSAVVRAAAPMADFGITTTAAVVAAMRLPALGGLNVIGSPRTYAALVDLIHSARVAWIPLEGGEDPTGFTNLIEALLCGTAVIIADCSTIPAEVLRLPGVYFYKTGDAQSLVEVTRRVLDESREPDFRARVRQAAGEVLNGRRLESAIRVALGLAGSSEASPGMARENREQIAESLP